MDKNQLKHTRIDKWLWAARFYKTRPLAVKAIKNGQISINGQRIKPAALVKIEDTITIKKGVYVLEVIVLAITEQRRSAPLAQNLYNETEESIKNKDLLKQQLASQPKIDIDRRKPDKRGVRSHRQLKRGG
ncbi:MAG: hypothetical protein KTR16_15810 [Acidiferrobacterales bacterium]|nr:hypothetical protein [Acidiferrobacterales bacterium]